MIASVAAGVFVLSTVAGQIDGGKPDVDPELRSAMAERLKANIEGDTARVESLMVDEYLQTDIFGRVQNKAEWLADYFKPLASLIQANRFRWDVWEEKDVQARQFGDAAVVVGGLTLVGLSGRMTIEIADDGHSYAFEYTLAETP
jgi:hypothetical protein